MPGDSAFLTCSQLMPMLTAECTEEQDTGFQAWLHIGILGKFVYMQILGLHPKEQDLFVTGFSLGIRFLRAPPGDLNVQQSLRTTVNTS